MSALTTRFHEYLKSREMRAYAHSDEIQWNIQTNLCRTRVYLYSFTNSITFITVSSVDQTVLANSRKWIPIKYAKTSLYLLFNADVNIYVQKGLRALR